MAGDDLPRLEVYNGIQVAKQGALPGDEVLVAVDPARNRLSWEECEKYARRFAAVNDLLAASLAIVEGYDAAHYVSKEQVDNLRFAVKMAGVQVAPPAPKFTISDG